MRTLVLGGARSGKSGYAESLLGPSLPVRYLATARRYPGDDDWDRRIEQHRVRRPAHWVTVEGVPLATTLGDHRDRPTLVDDLGTWLTGVFDDTESWDRDSGLHLPHTQALVAAIAAFTGELVIVSPEVGMGIVPETRGGRVFRDEIGLLNAQVAEVCDRVLLVVAGLALTLK